MPLARERLMICSYCASLVPADARVCQQCGAPQPLNSPRRWRREALASEHDARSAPFDSPLWLDSPETERSSRLARLLDRPHQAPTSRYGPPGAYPAPVPSFRTNAVIAFVLYLLFFLPGLIASAVWWNEARKVERRTGRTPPGKGCLTVMLYWGIAVIAFWVMIFAFV